MGNKVYLGDAVYADFNDANQLVLTVEDGIAPSDTIIIEPEIWAALRSYVKAHAPQWEELK